MRHRLNKYIWALIGKLADKQDKDGTDIYKSLLRLNKKYIWVLVQTDSANDFISEWALHGNGWMAERIKDQENGTVIKCYKGISMYTVDELKDFAEVVKGVCKENGIETMTPEELEEMECMMNG